MASCREGSKVSPTGEKDSTPTRASARAQLRAHEAHAFEQGVVLGGRLQRAVEVVDARAGAPWRGSPRRAPGRRRTRGRRACGSSRSPPACAARAPGTRLAGWRSSPAHRGRPRSRRRRRRRRRRPRRPAARRRASRLKPLGHVRPAGRGTGSGRSLAVLVLLLDRLPRLGHRALCRRLVHDLGVDDVLII